jgi:hypothetical protein
MSAPSFAESTLNLGSRIGRYFGLVSMVPALFLVLWTAVLAASGAWQGRPDPTLIGPRVGSWSFAGAAWLLLASLATAFFLHPLQFAMTQMLEGYWGYSRIARILIRSRIRHHRRRLRRATLIAEDLREQLSEQLAGISSTQPGSRENREQGAAIPDSPAGDRLSGLQAAIDAADHAAGRYPDDFFRVMPTRLGNALRAEEDRAGRQYAIDAILTAPHFALVAADKHVQYLRDTRQQMDTSVRLCVVSLLGALEAIACLITDGWWLLVALVPYALAYLAYRAAVAAADEYTTAVKTVIDLNRFTLYETLNVKRPSDTEEERKLNANLMLLLQGETVKLHYRKPPPTPVATPPGNP